MTRLLRAAAVLLLPVLAACSGNAATTLPEPTATAATTAVPAPTTTADPNRAADAAMCTKFDTGTTALAALVAKIKTGSITPAEPFAITIGKADIAIRDAAAKPPAADGTASDMVTFAVAIEALGKALGKPDAQGVVHVGNELSVVETDWSAVDAGCERAGYTLTSVIK